MGAIMRREFNAYFTSAIGYIFIAVFFFFSGMFFAQMFAAGYPDMSYLFSSLFSIVMFMVPILTMRLMSEDKKIKTDQALLTAPVNLAGVVLGKFFAAAAMFLVTISITIVQSLVMAAMTMPVKAPMPMKPAWPRLSSPEIPTTRFRDTARTM